MHWVRMAFCLALANAGRSIAARIAMIAITTNNSINVKAERVRAVFSLGRGVFMVWLWLSYAGEFGTTKLSFNEARCNSPSLTNSGDRPNTSGVGICALCYHYFYRDWSAVITPVCEKEPPDCGGDFNPSPEHCFHGGRSRMKKAGSSCSRPHPTNIMDKPGGRTRWPWSGQS